MRVPLPFAFLPALLILLGCGSGEPARNQEPIISGGSESQVAFEEPLVLEDASGRSIVLGNRPQRIVSLIPSATEILTTLGAGGLLAGRTDFDTAQALSHLPSVGGGLNPNLEAIVALRPDLVIRFDGDSDQATPLRLDEMGIPHLALRPDGIQDIRHTISVLGSITGRIPRADALLADMDSTLQEIRSRVQGRTPRRVAYLLGGSPPWVAGPGSYIEELIEWSGGINVFSDLAGLYGPVNLEVFLVREIDLILLPEGAEVELPTTGVPLRRVPPSLEIPGPKLAQDAWELARILHPEAFR